MSHALNFAPAHGFPLLFYSGAQIKDPSLSIHMWSGKWNHPLHEMQLLGSLEALFLVTDVPIRHGFPGVVAGLRLSQEGRDLIGHCSNSLTLLQYPTKKINWRS